MRRFGLVFRRSRVSLVLVSIAIALAASADAGGVKGHITGGEKLIPEVYAEAAKPDAHHYSWREASPTVKADFRVLAADPSRDICIAAISPGQAQKHDPIAIVVTGGHTVPTTIVVSPGTIISFQNHDPFTHRLYQLGAGGDAFKPDDLQSGKNRDWTAPSQGRFEFRDQLFGSVRFSVVVNPGVVDVVYPGRTGTFAFSNLPPGDYYFQAFFNGKPVGRQVAGVATRGSIELKDPLNVGEAAAP
jgi:hypothetical protein